MNKKSLMIIFIVLFSFAIFGGLFWYFSNNTNNNENTNYESNRISTNSDENINLDNNTVNNNNNNNNNEDFIINNTNTEEITQNIHDGNELYTSQEEIATFSTKIYSNDPARQNNVTITSETINNTIVKNGETFSFCGLVGPSSTKKGYQEAEIFDNTGKKIQGLGGRKLPSKYYSL